MKSITSNIVSLEHHTNRKSANQLGLDSTHSGVGFKMDSINDESDEMTTEGDRFKHVAAMRARRRYFVESLANTKTEAEISSKAYPLHPPFSQHNSEIKLPPPVTLSTPSPWDTSEYHRLPQKEVLTLFVFLFFCAIEYDNVAS